MVGYDRADAARGPVLRYPVAGARTNIKEATMPLDPQAQSLVDALAKLNLKLIEDSTPEEARESMRTRTAGLRPFPDGPAGIEHPVRLEEGGMTRCLYPSEGERSQPALVFFHLRGL